MVTTHHGREGAERAIAPEAPPSSEHPLESLCSPHLLPPLARWSSWNRIVEDHTNVLNRPTAPHARQDGDLGIIGIDIRVELQWVEGSHTEHEQAPFEEGGASHG